MAYEIAKVLGYSCAQIELAHDYDGVLGILNYLFVKIGSTEHIDAVSYLNIHDNERPLYYTISNIKNHRDNPVILLLILFPLPKIFYITQ